MTHDTRNAKHEDTKHETVNIAIKITKILRTNQHFFIVLTEFIDFFILFYIEINYYPRTGFFVPSLCHEISIYCNPIKSFQLLFVACNHFLF